MSSANSSVNWIEAATGAYQAGRQIVFLFDYDGTLTPIVRHPSLAALPAHTRELLISFTRVPDVSVAVVSGRALEDVRNMVAIPGVYFAGCGGMELDLLGTSLTHPDALRFGEMFDAAHRQLLEPLRRFPGAWVERKPTALAVHYRELTPLASVCLGIEVSEVLHRFAELRFRVVSAAVEVTPANGWDKGSAVEAVLGRVRTPGRSAPFPIYFGDAPNDEEGMSAALAAGGLAIGIGPDAPTAGEHKFPDPDALFKALTELHVRLTRPPVEPTHTKTGP
ncbi:MAG TPA: trehalose-phosphatase [Gemmata sp.]